MLSVDNKYVTKIQIYVAHSSTINNTPINYSTQNGIVVYFLLFYVYIEIVAIVKNYVEVSPKKSVLRSLSSIKLLRLFCFYVVVVTFENPEHAQNLLDRSC